jgi:hypothetical protein
VWIARYVVECVMNVDCEVIVDLRDECRLRKFDASGMCEVKMFIVRCTSVPVSSPVETDGSSYCLRYCARECPASVVACPYSALRGRRNPVPEESPRVSVGLKPTQAAATFFALKGRCSSNQFAKFSAQWNGSSPEDGGYSDDWKNRLWRNARSVGGEVADHVCSRARVGRPYASSLRDSSLSQGATC